MCFDVVQVQVRCRRKSLTFSFGLEACWKQWICLQCSLEQNAFHFGPSALCISIQKPHLTLVSWRRLFQRGSRGPRSLQPSGLSPRGLVCSGTSGSKQFCHPGGSSESLSHAGPCQGTLRARHWVPARTSRTLGLAPVHIPTAAQWWWMAGHGMPKCPIATRANLESDGCEINRHPSLTSISWTLNQLEPPGCRDHTSKSSGTSTQLGYRLDALQMKLWRKILRHLCQ